MFKKAYIMNYHYDAEGDALHIQFDKPIELTEDEQGRPVSSIRFMDWVANCRAANKKVEAAKNNLHQAELADEANIKASADAEYELEDILGSTYFDVDSADEVDFDEFEEEESRIRELFAIFELANKQQKDFDAALCEAKESLKEAKAEFRHWGAHLSDAWK